MISMSELLRFSKSIMDEYEGAKEPLNHAQQYWYDNLKSIRHHSVKQYIINQNFYSKQLLSICQEFALEKVFTRFQAMLIVSRLQMGDDLEDYSDYVN